MKFAGLIKNSFVDFPGNISAVVFTFGCNFNCWFCHNKALINEKTGKYDESEILEFLQSRKGFLDGVVISGGEPTINPSLKSFIKKVKAVGFKVKLDTNGTNPEILKELLEENLLDFVAMDIKTSLEKYENLTQTKVNLKNIEKSIKILLGSKINYEFRTTFAPDVTLNDIEKISQMISGAKAYAIQKYFSQQNSPLRKGHCFEDFQNALEISKKYINNSFLRSM